MNLRPYQNEGVKWLCERSHGLLSDEPGLGKTAQTIIAGDRALVNTVLVICPASARHNWADEVEKWSMFGHEVNIITERHHAPRENAYNIVNYDKFSRALDAKNKPSAFLKKFTNIKWDLVICDEAHLLKEKSSKRTKAILGQQGGIHGSTKRLWLLTGTPMPNHPGELWTVLCAMGATQDNYSDFTKSFCVFQNYFQRFQPTGANPASAPALAELLNSVMLRRLKKDVAKDLPELSITDWSLPPVKVNVETIFGSDPKIKEVLAEQEEEVRRLWEKLDANVPMETALRAVKALGPMVSEYRRWLGIVKAESAAIAIKEELSCGQYDKIVIFAHHKQVVKRLKESLSEYNPQVISGETSAIGRKDAVDTFQNDPKARVFIGNIAAAGTALTLTAAAEVVVVEPDWVPANNAQAIQRCHRIGQTIPVRARMAKLADSLDNRISEVLRRKTADIISIVGN